MTCQNKCEKCGKKLFADNLCEICYLEIHPLLLKFKELNIEVCPICFRYFNVGKWTKAASAMEAIHKSVEQRLFLDKNVSEVQIDGLTPSRKLNPGANIKSIAEVTLYGTVEGKKAKDQYSIPFNLTMTLCNNCRKVNSQYFEGVLQIRNAKENDSIYEYIHNQVAKFETRGVFITKEVPEKNGRDFYLTSKKFQRTLSDKLVSEFGGKLKSNPRLFSRNRQTSKDIYRLSTYLHLPDFRKGDAIKIDDKIIQISSIGKKITGTDLHTGKRFSIEAKNLEKKAIPLNTAKTQLIKTNPTVEVLHPETFQSAEVRNPDKLPKDAKAGDEVTVFYDGNIVLLA